MTISSNESTVFNTYKNGYLWSWDYSYVNNGVSPSNDVSNYSTIYMYVFMENKGELYTRDSASASYFLFNISYLDSYRVNDGNSSRGVNY